MKERWTLCAVPRWAGVFAVCQTRFAWHLTWLMWHQRATGGQALLHYWLAVQLEACIAAGRIEVG
jgi:hypothetical protein